MTQTSRYGKQEYTYKQNRKRILASQDLCGICGGVVDKSLPFPHPMSAAIDHIIPIAKGGTSDLPNLQLSHLLCNRIKSDKVTSEKGVSEYSARKNVGNRVLPQPADFLNFSSTI